MVLFPFSKFCKTNLHVLMVKILGCMFMHFLVMTGLFWWLVFCNSMMDQITLWLCGVFLFQVRPVAEDEMFKVLRTGKRKSKYSITYSFLGFCSSDAKIPFHFYAVESSYLLCSLYKFESSDLLLATNFYFDFFPLNAWYWVTNKLFLIASFWSNQFYLANTIICICLEQMENLK